MNSSFAWHVLILNNIKFNHFKVHNSVALSTFPMLCNHHHYVVPEYFHLPKGNPCTHWQSCPTFPFHPRCWQPLISFLSLWICLFWIFHINGIIQLVAFCIWLLSLSIMFSRSIHVVSVLHPFLWLNNLPFLKSDVL